MDNILLAWHCKESDCGDVEARFIGVEDGWDEAECASCGSEDGAFVLIVPMSEDQRSDVFNIGRVTLHVQDGIVE